MKRTQRDVHINDDDQSKRRKLSYDIIPNEVQRVIFSFFDLHGLIDTVSLLNSQLNTFVNSNEELWIHQYNSRFASSSSTVPSPPQYNHTLYHASTFPLSTSSLQQVSNVTPMILKKYMDTKERMKIAHNLSVITNNNTTHAGRGNHDGVMVVPVKKFPDNLIYNLFRKRLDMEKYWSKKMISFTAVPSEEYRQEFYEGNNIIELLETMKKKDEGIEIQRDIPVDNAMWYWKDGKDFTPYEIADNPKIEREYILYVCLYVCTYICISVDSNTIAGLMDRELLIWDSIL